jgi:Fur family peroxide stress response transcriptional regulator
MVKRTRQKELIVRALRGNHYHPTALWIYDEVRKEMPHISLATVYRNLRLFLDSGEISELEFDGSVSHFDIRADEHQHFWCDKCDRIFDIEEMVTKEFNGRLAQGNGFEISKYRLVLRGLCPACQLDREANNNT